MPLLVRGIECVGDLPAIASASARRSGPRAIRSASVSPSTSSRTSAVHAVGLFDAVNRGDVGMVERGQDARLALEARQPVGIRGEHRRQHLDRDLAPEPRVARAIDLAHAAGANPLLHLINADPLSSHGHLGDIIQMFDVAVEKSWRKDPPRMASTGPVDSTPCCPTDAFRMP